jgi:hypothetical protein
VSIYNTFTPTVFIGCTLWLDAADSSSISTTSGNVTQWRDKSGNANHTTAGTGQPTYTSPFVIFGGSAQLILPLIFSTDWSIFIVARTTQTTGTSGGQWYNGAGLFDAEITNTQNDYGMNIVGGFLATGVGNPDTTIQSASQVNTGNLFIAEFLRNSSTGVMSNIITGGTAVTTTGPTGIRNSVSRISLGALQTNLNYFVGSIAEVIAFNTVITESQRQNIEGYLAWKWGFVSSLPANHPGARTNLPLYVIPLEPYFNPRSISSCVLWLDGLDPAGTGTAPSVGATVSTWTDKSTSAKNATAGGTPTYVSGGGINFNGSSWFSNLSFAQNLSQRSIFIVMQETTRNTVYGVFPLIPNPSSGTDFQSTTGLSIETSNGLRFYGNSGAYSSDLGSSTLLVKAVYNDNMNETTGSGFVNGTNATNVTASYTAGTCSGYGVGSRWQGASGISASLALNGVIYEIMYFNSPLSLSDRQNVEGYLAQKWGLTASLPVGHPGLTQTLYSATPRLTLSGLSTIMNWTNRQNPSSSITSALLNTIAIYLRDYMSEFRNPSFYGYALDGNSYFITDGGGNDMYDTGNWTYPWLISGTQYTGVSGSQQVFSINYSSTTATTVDTDFVYVSLGYTQSAGVSILSVHPLTVLGFRTTTGRPVGFQLGGNSGADGAGTLASGILYAGDVIQGFTVHAFYRETYNATDPSHCNLFILLGHPSWGSVFGTISSFADPVANGGNGCYFFTSGAGVSNILAVQTLLSKAGGALVTSTECQTVVQAFVNRIKLAVGF